MSANPAAIRAEFSPNEGYSNDIPIARLDIKDTAARAIAHLEAICAAWLPDGKRVGHDWVALNPTRADNSAGSFSVSLLTGGCIDHATGEAAGDIVSTIRYLDGLATQLDAARKVADFIGATPLPDITPAKQKAASKPMATRPTAHHKLGKPSAEWEYKDADGHLLSVVMRFETETGKEFRPVTQTAEGWYWRAPPEPRPLYGLDRLAAQPAAHVILAEGEKAADAAALLLPECVCIASMNGAMSPKKSDWSPLKGRRIWIWPDADAAGAEFAKTAAKLALAASALSVDILDVSVFGSDLPKGWDAADALDEGWTHDQIIQSARFIPGGQARTEPDVAPANEEMPRASTGIEEARKARIDAARRECKEKLDAFNALHGVVMIEGRACIVYREINAGTGRHTTRYSTPKDISLRYKPSKVPVVKEHSNGRVEIEKASLFSLWLEWERRRTYSQLIFKPVPGLIAGDVTLPDTDVLNLYQGLAITPQRGRCELIKAHIQNTWCSGDPALYTYVLGWLARMFQRPQERGHTVIVLRSGEGTGKNIIVDILVEAFGEHAMIAVKPDDLTGRFNDDLGTSVLVFANEAVWGGRKELEGALKSLITDEELPIERKFIPRFRVKNCCHLLMASNNDWVAPIGLDDRRFVVLDVDEGRQGDFEYFRALKAEIENGGQEAFVWELLERDISAFEPRKLPECRAFQATKFDAKVRGADSVTQWWIDCLYSGEIMASVEREEAAGITTRLVRQRENLVPDWELGRVEVERDALYNAYVEWATRLRRHVDSQASFGRKIRTLTEVTDTRRGPKGGPLKRMYSMDCLDTARACLDTAMQQPGPWQFEGQEEHGQ